MEFVSGKQNCALAGFDGKPRAEFLKMPVVPD